MRNTGLNFLTSLNAIAGDRSDSAFDFQIDTICDLEGMYGLERSWRTLENKCEKPFTYFQTFDWCVAWFHIFGAEHSTQNKPQARVFTARRDGELVLLWPLMVDQGPLGLSCLTTLSMPHAQYSNVVLTPDQAGREALSQCWQHIKSQSGIDAIDLPKIPVGTALADTVLTDEERDAPSDASAIMDLTLFEDWEHYVSSLSRNLRKGRNRRRRKLESLGPLSVSVHASGTEDFQRIVALSIEMKRDWLAENGKVSRALSKPGNVAFFSSLPTDGRDQCRVLAFELRQNDKMIAAEFGFEHNGHYISYLGAFDWSLRDYSPGKVQIEMMLKWCMENAVKSFDLLGNATAYKSGWSNVDMPLADHQTGLTLLGSAHSKLWAKHLRPALKSTMESVPTDTRRKLFAAVGAPKSRVQDK
jgi:CelD/BcsL family acetyltransferase involved in cellulose biosynthesis